MAPCHQLRPADIHLRVSRGQEQTEVKSRRRFLLAIRKGRRIFASRHEPTSKIASPADECILQEQYQEIDITLKQVMGPQKIHVPTEPFLPNNGHFHSTVPKLIQGLPATDVRSTCSYGSKITQSDT